MQKTLKKAYWCDTRQGDERRRLGYYWPRSIWEARPCPVLPVHHSKLLPKDWGAYNNTRLLCLSAHTHPAPPRPAQHRLDSHHSTPEQKTERARVLAVLARGKVALPGAEDETIGPSWSSARQLGSPAARPPMTCDSRCRNAAIRFAVPRESRHRLFTLVKPMRPRLCLAQTLRNR